MPLSKQYEMRNTTSGTYIFISTPNLGNSIRAYELDNYGTDAQSRSIGSMHHKHAQRA